MITFGGGETIAFALAALHHFIFGFEAGDMPVGSLARIVHVIVTVALPTIFVLGSCAFALRSTRSRQSPAPADPPSVVAFSTSDRSGTSGAGDDRRRGERRAPGAVDRFYRVRFADDHAFRAWSERVRDFVTALQNIAPDLMEPRVVVFVPLMPTLGAPVSAYVSEGARGFSSILFGSAHVEWSPVPMAELPDGLSLLFGEGVDADAYARRGSRGGA
jgi:hypothetical protein